MTKSLKKVLKKTSTTKKRAQKNKFTQKSTQQTEVTQNSTQKSKIQFEFYSKKYLNKHLKSNITQKVNSLKKYSKKALKILYFTK